jgi:hypothetical protein
MMTYRLFIHKQPEAINVISPLLRQTTLAVQASSEKSDSLKISSFKTL